MHLHSIYSDGIVSTNEIIKSLKEIKIKGFSLTDHDTISGINNLNELVTDIGLDIISGVEFGVTFEKKEIHILGYYIDINNKEITKLISSAITDRVSRTNRIISKLLKLGIDINREEVETIAAKDIVSRSHIANILVKKKYCKNVKEAFDIYLGPEGSAYVGKEFSSPKNIIDTIKNSGGVAILAHPKTIGSDEIVEEIINYGIDGLEIVNSKHKLDDIIRYYNLAEHYNLIKTSGSDCHGKLIKKYKYIGRFSQNKKNIKKIKYLHNIRIKKN